MSGQSGDSEPSRIMSIAYEMRRSILEFTDAGFEPLKRVCKAFLAFERTEMRRNQAAKRLEEAQVTFKYDFLLC